MPNFSVQVAGEGVPRSFRYDLETKELSTDFEVDDPAFAGKKQAEAKITEGNYQSNPDYIRFWEGTATHRLAYELCESEGIALDDALLMAENMNGNGMPTEKPGAVSFVQPMPDVMPSNSSPPSVEPEPTTSPLAGIVITNQQLILSMMFELLEQYIDEDDKNHKLVELLKNKVEELDGYEIVI